MTDEQQAELDALKKQRDELAKQRAEAQNQLMALRHRVRVGGHMPDLEYRDICRKQQKLNGLIVQLDGQLRPLKERMREFGAIIHANNQRKNEEKNRGEVAAIGVRELLKMVDVLRAKYRDFQKDPTRVSTMRLMAAEFADELQDVIKAAGKL
jgi:chromosome segregation ATPase